MAINANTVLQSSDVSGNRAVLRFTGTGSVLVAKVGATPSDIAETSVSTANVITGAISGLQWSTSAGKITVARGGNTIVILSGTGNWTRPTGFIPINQDPAANLAITFDASAASNGVIIVEMSKKYGS